MTSQKQLMKSSETKIVVRRCVGCLSNKPVTELMKITKNSKTGDVVVCPDVSVNGRSVYLCRSDACLKLAKKKGKLSKSFKFRVDERLFEKISAVLTN